MHGFAIDKQQLRKITNYSIVSDTVNYLEFSFAFSADWDGVKKYAQFTHGESTYEVEIVDGVISANSEVALSPGEWGIKVIGALKDGLATVKRVTTNTVALFVLDSGLTDGEPFPAVGGSIGEQIVASEEDRVAAESSRVAAELVRSDAESSRALAEQARDSAEELRESAEIEREQTMSTGHNAFNGLQGGSAGEYYHMTQAQNAALHAHSNKTALDAVSGTNTGDQDVSGAISTHNTDAGAHAGQFAPINAQLATDAITHMLATEFSGAYEGVDLSVRFATEIASYSDVWVWIKARVQAENFAGLHVHDYITVTCTNDAAYVLKMEIAGINTYKGSGETEIPAHIDWISKDCWPNTVPYNLVNFNNGIGCDKFTATAGQTAFQLTYRGSVYPSSITSMTVNGVANTNFTYNSATGIMAYTGAALSAGAIVKTFWAAVSVPFMASNLNAYMNSLKMGVPNEAALDPFLTEVDYSAGGIYYYLPSALKAVIAPKRMYAGTRYTAGSLLTSSNNYSDVSIGPLWIPEEMEVFGSPLFATGTNDKLYARQYPCFVGGNRKKGAGNVGSRASWWVFPAYSGVSAYFYFAASTGTVSYSAAANALRVPVCFRIKKI